MRVSSLILVPTEPQNVYIVLVIETKNIVKVDIKGKLSLVVPGKKMNECSIGLQKILRKKMKNVSL